MIDQATTVIDLALISGVLSIAIYLTYRILDFPDLTIDGSYVLGASLSAITLKSGYCSYITLIISFICGALSGLLTSILHLKFRINGILASILVMTMLYSINFRIMGASNISIFHMDISLGQYSSLILIFLTCMIITSLIFLFKTYFGLVLIAVGQNSNACRLYMVNTNLHKCFLICLSNGISALMGGVMLYYQGFCDISMGFGTVITGLACIMLGESLRKKNSNITKQLFFIILGSIVYRTLIQIALNLDDLGLKSSDLKLITSIMVIISIILSQLRKGYQS
jgi:putative ABC transport system permease protein